MLNGYMSNDYIVTMTIEQRMADIRRELKADAEARQITGSFWGFISSMVKGTSAAAAHHVRSAASERKSIPAARHI